MTTMFRKGLLMTVCASLLAGTAVSQTASQNPPLQPVQWDSRRLDQLDRNVRRLERAVTQRNAQGQPVLVEPDPEVIALQGRVAQMDRRLQDLEQTVQRVNGDMERLTFQLDEVTRDNAALKDRLDDSEQRLKAADDAAKAQAAQAVQAQSQQQAEAAPPQAATTGTAVGDLAAARALVATDPVQAATALEAVVANWPGTPQGREAGWRLGDIKRAGNDMAGAVRAYAGSLSGWPGEAWAGEVTLKLARGLVATNRKPQACAAIGEFDRRYAGTASAALKAVATQTRGQAGCPA